MSDSAAGKSLHFMTPLLAPRSIALVGGSPREGTVGNRTLRALTQGGFAGRLEVVNPRYESVEGLTCRASLAELDEPADMAILSVRAQRMEQILAEAIQAGVRSAVIFDPCFFEGEGEPPLLERLKAIVGEAGIPVCGGNGMGYLNYDARTFASYSLPAARTPGHIAAFCHSGSAFGLLAHADPRHRFNLLTSQGQEIGASVAEYMDYALDQPSTRVLTLFIEAVRDPDRFIEVLGKAERLQIPVVVTKVGRTDESARLAKTHSGALAGNDSAFDAVCRRYGVIRTDDLDTLLATAQILAMDRRIGCGGLAALLDSGGLREQLIDLAADVGVEFSRLEPGSVRRLRERLPYGLAPVNPLDAAGRLTADYEPCIVDCLDILAEDANTALLAHELYVTDLSPPSALLEEAKRMPAKQDTPYVLTYSLATVRNAGVASDLMDCGVPLINGTSTLLAAVKNAFTYRDFLLEAHEPPVELDSKPVTRWRARLEDARELRETEALCMLRELGLDAVQSVECASEESAVEIAEQLGFPVALKTAADGIRHKSDVGGVLPGLADADAVRDAYRQLARIGPRVAVAEMAGSGVEIAFGMVNDAQFGPIVMLGAGGVLVEVVDDKVFALPPFGTPAAKRLLERLRIARLLSGARGQAPVDLDALANALSRFSMICHAFADRIAELDVNPIIATASGCSAVDANFVPMTGDGSA